MNEKVERQRAINSAWVERQTRSEASRRLYEQERLSVWALELLSELMKKENLSKADLARRLGVSAPYVTKVLSGEQNVSLNKLADLFWACGSRAQLRAQPLRNGNFVSIPARAVSQTKPKVVQLFSRPDDLTCLEGANESFDAALTG